MVREISERVLVSVVLGVLAAALISVVADTSQRAETVAADLAANTHGYVFIAVLLAPLVENLLQTLIVGLCFRLGSTEATAFAVALGVAIALHALTSVPWALAVAGPLAISVLTLLAFRQSHGWLVAWLLSSAVHAGHNFVGVSMIATAQLFSV